ncbi:hypothetical protein BC351_28960 [Paenibacillus ferrarius]|uniref:ATPase dynein-related AAA domain-containing protein n=1 Tax=Paenibacillus ferrarius TaxID=1469647 RepID=A0A1V4HHW4_9BACL|nr:AAA family ATPase [Paenibacillus ferrarius]OPH56201.1 hypothetical protein BC351_28960 [Paenibacillus ferrarius]
MSEITILIDRINGNGTNYDHFNIYSKTANYVSEIWELIDQIGLNSRSFNKDFNPNMIKCSNPLRRDDILIMNGLDKEIVPYADRPEIYETLNGTDWDKYIIYKLYLLITNGSFNTVYDNEGKSYSIKFEWSGHIPEPLDVTTSDGEGNPDELEGNPIDIFSQIESHFSSVGLKISQKTLGRYHLSLRNRSFVILSGISGTGKTWMAQTYAEAIGARYLIVPVSPNWMSNEDLLGFYHLIHNQYQHTEFSRFVLAAAEEYQQALESGRNPVQFHVILDEMNLARVEYYFSKFLSLMEVRSRGGEAIIELSSEENLLLPPNLFVIGTVNVDETTHLFADKVYDRAQLIEIELNREDLYKHLSGKPYQEIVMQIWDVIHQVAPFAFRVVDDIMAYITDAEEIGWKWTDALDEQILQKILPKIKGTNIAIGEVLTALLAVLPPEEYPISHKKVLKINEGYTTYGIATYF